MGERLSFAQAQRRREALRRQGKTVVFTNGVFDLLHVGHVRNLQAAKALGDALFVGLNSDASAAQLKGPGQPFTPQEERAEILCALSAVDCVVVFQEMTAEKLVLGLRPDVYTKGGDYAPQTGVGKVPPEAPAVAAYGGRVVILPFTSGHSTSDMLARIRANETQPGE